MMSESTEATLIATCADYLQTTYGEELLEWEILDNSVDEGNGRLRMECVVRAGASRSRWQKTFTFKNGRVSNMTWQYLG
jgi:hypothetical protein